jgi:hypothetical protein
MVRLTDMPGTFLAIRVRPVSSKALGQPIRPDDAAAVVERLTSRIANLTGCHARPSVAPPTLQFPMNRRVNGIASGSLLSGSLQREKLHSCSQILRCLAAIAKQCNQKTGAGPRWTIIPPQPLELPSVRTWTRGETSSCKAGPMCLRRSQPSGAFFSCATSLGRSFGTGAIDQQADHPRQFGVHPEQQQKGTQHAKADLLYRSECTRRHRRNFCLVTKRARLFARQHCIGLPPSAPGAFGGGSGDDTGDVAG